MDDVLAALGEQHAELATVLAGRSEAEWRKPTPCAGWDVTDVVLHLVQTDRLAVASLDDTFGAVVESFAEALAANPPTDAATDGAFSIDAAAAWQVAQERGAPGASVGAQWEAQAAALRARCAAADPHARVEWVAGRLSVRTLATTRLAECWIHTTDVATALGVTLAPGVRLQLVARLAWRTLPYAFARAGLAPPGPVGFALVGPDGEPWELGLDADPPTVVHGPAYDLCRVAARRVDPAATALRATGPDADAVLALVRTYA
jgi:uncharacterized protein (TIGR03084 family)